MIQNQNSMAAVESVLIGGDLSRLSAEQRVTYYKSVCDTLALNPLTKPFDYITLNGKLVLYATKGCAEQLRAVHKVSIVVTGRETIEGVYVVTAQAKLPDGREDGATGAVSIQGLKGEALANAFMKAETKAKRRATLSICGLNMLDETEVETIEPSLKDQARSEPLLNHDDRPGMIYFGYYQRRMPHEVPRDKLEAERDRLANHKDPRALQAFTVIDEYLKLSEGIEPEEAAIEPHPNAGDYQIPFGKKYLGRRIADIPQAELDSYIGWLEADAAKKKQYVGAEVKQLIEAYKAYYGV